MSRCEYAVTAQVPGLTAAGRTPPLWMHFQALALDTGKRSGEDSDRQVSIPIAATPFRLPSGCCGKDASPRLTGRAPA